MRSRATRILACGSIADVVSEVVVTDPILSTKRFGLDLDEIRG
ncbi:hypothetical protein SynMEDNS5_01261 [Synechococcus sp. MEDNS5]|nr:hypothetical protein SynMEDNS5_01261 [Synechococcus sp. MEDNS5]